MKPQRLIQIDWIAGAVAGVLMLSLRGWLAELFALPSDLLLFVGVANLAYACASFTIAMRSRGDHVPFLRVIAVANIGWALGCAVMAIVWFGEATVFGMIQFISEALFVGGLGVLEWRAAGTTAPALDPTPS